MSGCGSKTNKRSCDSLYPKRLSLCNPLLKYGLVLRIAFYFVLAREDETFDFRLESRRTEFVL